MKPEEVSRHVPYDVELEQAVLGSCLIDNKLIDVVAGELDPEQFYDPLHQRLCEMICYLQTEGAVTPLILHAVMKADPGLQEVGGHAYLVGLVQAAPAMPNLRDYARILRDLSTRRQMIKIGEDLVNDSYDQPHDHPARISIGRATERLLSIGDLTARRLSKIGDAAHSSILKLEDRLARMKSGLKSTSITTGSRKMDKAIGGLMPGDRVGIAARTGMGKSLVSGSMALAAAMEGAPVLIMSADMREQQVAERMLCDMDRHLNPGLKPIHYRRFRTGTFSDSEWERIVIAQQHLATLHMHIDDNPKINVALINGRTRALATAYPDQQGLLVVDFLQKVEPTEDRYRDRRRDEDLTAISYGLGDIVKPIGWSLLELIQIANKETDAKGQLREDPPSVASIRESGGIEMSLDIIFTPFRKAFFIESREPEGRGFAEGPPPAWLAWRAELTEQQHRLRTIGWKNRDGQKSDLNLDLWCDAGSASMRDEEPRSVAETARDRDLLDMAT